MFKRSKTFSVLIVEWLSDDTFIGWNIKPHWKCITFNLRKYYGTLSKVGLKICSIFPLLLQIYICTLKRLGNYASDSLESVLNLPVYFLYKGYRLYNQGNV